MPRAREAIGIREKLLSYSLDPTHESGGPKARGFALILGIKAIHADRVEATIRTKILTAPVRSMRNNPPYGINCLVEFPLNGVDQKAARMVDLRTTWEFAGAAAPPRMVTAFLRP